VIGRNLKLSYLRKLSELSGIPWRSRALQQPRRHVPRRQAAASLRSSPRRRVLRREAVKPRSRSKSSTIRDFEPSPGRSFKRKRRRVRTLRRILLRPSARPGRGWWALPARRVPRLGRDGRAVSSRSTSLYALITHYNLLTSNALESSSEPFLVIRKSAVEIRLSRVVHFTRNRPSTSSRIVHRPGPGYRMA
jgi:hypothetical protein